MAIYTDRSLFVELGDIFRDAQLTLGNCSKGSEAIDAIASTILRLASEGRSPSEIRSSVIQAIVKNDLASSSLGAEVHKAAPKAARTRQHRLLDRRR